MTMNELLLQIKPWIEWMHLHPYWVGWITFAISFFECVALIGFFVPGAVLITAVSSLVGSGMVPLSVVLIPAIIGAILGDALSFGLGYYYRDHLRDIWPFKYYPHLLQKGESFFYRHGGISILIARFIGPVRPMLPLIVGMLNMSPGRFAAANVISAVVWAPLYMLPGILLGKASIQLPPDIALHLMLYVILILLALWCVSWLIKRLIMWIFNTLHKGLDKLWCVIKHRPLLHPLHIALQDPLHPESHAQLTLGLYFIFISVVFIGLAWSVFTHGVFTSWNPAVFFFLRSLRNFSADHIFILLTILGESNVILGVFIVMLLWFLGVRAYRTAGHWSLLALLSAGSVEIFKRLIHSPRPWGLTVMPAGYSFPSGHTALSAVMAGFFAILAARELKNVHRWIPYTCATLLVLAIALSRLYLSAHWFTDVIGGMLLALSIVMLVTLSYRRHATPQLKLLPLCLVFLLSWGSFAAIYGIRHYHEMVKNYAVSVSARVLKMNDWWIYEGLDEPLYRLDRTGKPAQVLNIQWAGNIKDIQRYLTGKGWQVSPTTTFNAILARINKSSKADKKIEVPVLPPLYLEQHPVLMMTKNLVSPDSILLLSLWNSKTRFTDSSTPLWLGNIAYLYKGEAGFFRYRPKKVNLSIPPAVELLEADLNDYLWKQLSYPFSPRRAFYKLAWDGQIVLIKPKEGESE